MTQSLNPINPASAHIFVQGKEFVYNIPPATVGGPTNIGRFVIKGVALSATGSTGLGIDDILADDYNDFMVNVIIPKLTYLNVNCIRVYQVDPSNSHQKTMDSLKAVGIYVMVGLATPEYSINRMTGEYGYGIFNHAAQVVTEFGNYDNTLCFSVGNEVQFPGEQATMLRDANTTASNSQIVADTLVLQVKVAQAMKSFARDVKAFMAAQTIRPIPVGVAMQDGPQTNWDSTNPNPYQVGILGTDSIAQYYGAGSEADRMDFIGINTYAYVSGLGQHKTAYDRLGTEASSLGIPVFLSETGAITNPRTWAVVPEMYTRSQLYSQLSGQIAFQMLEEGSGFGLYTVSGTYPNSVLTAQPDKGADDLATEFGASVPSPLNPASTTPTPPALAPGTFGTKTPVTVTWPTHLLPPYTQKTANTSITVENYSTTSEIQITQLSTVMGTVPMASSSSSPGSATLNVFAQTALSIQAQNGTNWDAVCGVAAKNVTAGITIKTDVQWGEYTGCNIELAEGNSININISNYAPNDVDVVIGTTKVATVPKSTDGSTPTNQTVPISKIESLNLNKTGTNTPICNMTPLMLTDGVTIENNLGWGQTCNIPIGGSGSMSVTVENYNTTAEMQVFQNGWSIGTVACATAANSPTSEVIEIDVLNDIYLKYTNGKATDVACMVPISAVKEWMTISNNVAQYGGVCILNYSGT